ncbi:MAG: peptide deformylase [Gemmatimonadetes bacterium]|nr:peptide deformylase [Gemmatimonadota bacterium]
MTAAVERHTQVVVEAHDVTGTPFTLQAEGALADCLQHELDHLDGVLYIDHLSPLKRQLLMRQYRKLDAQRQA